MIQFEDVFQDVKEPMMGMLTANLFFSMLPLHFDDPDRVLALTIVGAYFYLGYSVDELVVHP